MNPNPNLQINPQNLLTLYLQQNYNQISEQFISIFTEFEKTTYISLSKQATYFVNAFIKNFLYIFTQPDYFIDDRYVVKFIQLNPTIANLVAISSFKTTDAYLDILQEQEKNFVKILTLYSARNTVKIDYNSLFNANAELACLWYSHFFELYRSSLINQNAQQNLLNHLTYQHSKLTTFHNISDVYFGATYIDGWQDRLIKQKINQSLQKTLANTQTQINNQPNPKKIAVITCLWYSQHSVYRTLSKFVESLRPDYHLTLIHIGKHHQYLQTDIFQEVKYIDYENGQLNLDAVVNNDYIAIYYPDVGMSNESILLANLRLAPIQICGVGHSVSTFGSEIDYYISGNDVESPANYSKNYGERLVLLPGAGLINNTPNYQLKNIQKTRSEFIINCSWYAHKINHRMLTILKKILKLSPQKILYRFYVGGVESVLRKNAFIPLSQDFNDFFENRDCFEIVPGKPYNEYMSLMEEGDIAIEPYHFGGCNTIVDSLYLRQPTVSFQGQKWYNRIGSQMLRQVGLEELIATNTETYINLILKLVTDDNYRLGIVQKLQQTDLNATLFNTDSQHYFKTAIDFLIGNYQQLQQDKSSDPIYIN